MFGKEFLTAGFQQCQALHCGKYICEDEELQCFELKQLFLQKRFQPRQPFTSSSMNIKGNAGLLSLFCGFGAQRGQGLIFKSLV